MKKVLSVLLAISMTLGMAFCLPMSVGASFALSNDAYSDITLLDVDFSDVLEPSMTSEEIAAVLKELGMDAKSGTVTYAFDGEDLAVTAEKSTVLYLAKGKLNAIQNMQSLTIDTGISIQDTTLSDWSMSFSNQTQNNDYWKVQLTPATTATDKNMFYKIDVGEKVGGTQLYSSGTTEIVKDLGNNKDAYPNTSITFASRTELSVNIDRMSGLSVYVDGQLCTAFYQATAALTSWRNNVNTFMNQDDLYLSLNEGTTVKMNYLRVYDYIPEMTITEVCYSGVDAVEIYNSSQKPLNVYDYCLFVSATNSGVASFWQDNSSPDVGSKWGQASEAIGYTIPGDYTYIYGEPDGASGLKAVTDGVARTQVTLSNPAYDQGVLQPGECAVLYIPAHAIGKKSSDATAPLSLDTFKATYGVSSKVFYCYSCVDLNVASSADDKTIDAQVSTVIGLADVTFEKDTGLPTVVGTTYVRNQPAFPCLRQIDYGKYISWVVVTYGADGVTVVGQSYPATGSAVEGSSAEFRNIGRYSELLSGNAAEKPHTMGTVSDAQKITLTTGFVSTVIDLYGNRSEVSLVMDETRELPALEGAVWKDSSGNTVTQIKANAEDTYTQTTELPLLIGYQSTVAVTDGKYDVRFVASLASLKYQEIGFEITAVYGENDSQTFNQSCKFVYTAIHGNGNEYAAKDFGGEYLMVMHITDIPADAGTVTYTVKPYAKTLAGEIVYGIGGTARLAAPAN